MPVLNDLSGVHAVSLGVHEGAAGGGESAIMKGVDGVVVFGVEMGRAAAFELVVVVVKVA